MELPNALDAWTLQTVLDIVGEHEFEPVWFDFKEVLNPTQASGRDALRASIRKTACAMANTAGGYLIFGIADLRSRPSSRPEDLVVGIPLGGDLRREFGQKIDGILPRVRFDATPRPIPLHADSSRGLFIVHIPPSPLRPHMVLHDGIFYRRHDGGAAASMGYYEVRDQMLHTEDRLRKVTFLRLEMRQYQTLAARVRDLAERLEARDGAPADFMEHFDTSAFKPLLADVCALLPSTEFLDDLLQIPRATSAINLWLAAMSFHSRGQPNHDMDPVDDEELMHIYDAAGDVMRRCEELEKRLAELFGPLTGSQ